MNEEKETEFIKPSFSLITFARTRRHTNHGGKTMRAPDL